MEGVKRKRRCQTECKDHILNIKTLKGNASKYDFNQSFCPKFQREPLPPEHTFPEYNDDGKFYTSAFILGVDRRVLVKNQQQQLMDHQKQIRDSLEKHNQLVFPRPNSKHSLCSVCKEHYKNYYYHISSEDHRDRIALSQYNYYIKQLCNPYKDLWEGAEQRADEEAQKRYEEEQLRRQQLAQMTIQEGEQYQSLQEVQRDYNVDPDQERQDDDDDAEALYTVKSRDQRSKKYISRQAYNQDTVPLQQRPCKRIAREGRTYQSQYMRKKLNLNSGAINVNRFQRQKRQNRYERQRDRLKIDRENHQNKQFVKAVEQEGDVFVIMKSSSIVIATAPTITLSPQKVQPQKQNISVQGTGEFVWKRTTDKFKKQISKLQDKGGKCTPEKYQRQNKKYQIEYFNEERPQRLDQREKGQSKYPYPYYNYPPMPPYMPPVQYNKQFKTPNQVGKPVSDAYKNAPPNPYYYNPYMYPMYQSQYPRSQKSHDYPPYNQKDKSKTGDKSFSQKSQGQRPYDYMSYHWPYHNPYYMPPPLHSLPPAQSNGQTDRRSTGISKNTGSEATSPYGGNTSININFPMYMCPPSHQGMPPPYSMPPSRYPGQMNPHYTNYQYPYMPGPQEGEYTGIASEQHNQSNKSSLPAQSPGHRQHLNQRNMQPQQSISTHPHNLVPQYPHHMPMPGKPQLPSHSTHPNHHYPTYGNYNNPYPPHYQSPQSLSGPLPK